MLRMVDYRVGKISKHNKYRNVPNANLGTTSHYQPSTSHAHIFFSLKHYDKFKHDFRVHSRCPIEGGVIQTEWGTISPGTLIAAIASSLEAQRVLISEILNAETFQDDVAEPLMSSAKREWVDNIETLDEDQMSRQMETSSISNIWVATLAGKFDNSNSNAICNIR